VSSGETRRSRFLKSFMAAVYVYGRTRSIAMKKGDDDERDVIGSPPALPVIGQPGGPPAVAPPVAGEPHGYVGAALRLVANSPPSRAFTRLRASLLQQP
jgi:hypothetical protein